MYTPNDIIIITHYLTSEAPLQMILDRSRAKMLFIIYRREIQNGRSLRTVEPFFRLYNAVYTNSFYVFFHKNLNIIDFTKGEEYVTRCKRFDRE